MRKDVTDDQAVVADILNRAEYVTLALVDEEGPYSVPVNAALEGGVLYLHSSKKGRKAEAFRLAMATGTRVAFSAAVDLEPKTGELACQWGYKFRCVLGSGHVREVALAGDKVAALNVLMRKHAGRDDFPYDEGILDKTYVLAIDIDRATARLKLT
ncbi:MAG: pyridoxamine 5'-phosphate oxidase family protein [Humidesulfovibrio sp.]|uniref:pyridoxamine 5'-phosphate oxidase family protein n=1 Tax=Humidesulfovibrio sp. TaxID=2910988 RepID=UPI0027EBDD9F|nr:pyridoxamine 5'-phosphate oxidase family protein [Humidesulfovibrio sp.]MDQ7834122.1 pyridoxamine 5'-phosphate oxidase family protein [Humidesulfovibrio sp.]